ncbi:uncharacterized protein LOC134678094 [Cydia fagiglandana]|uniref:uncharacterized protein LOC134678094 n=1 Tax=Cydia fagiglandana TaxID=1458189 RepID=UPI002FEE5F24
MAMDCRHILEERSEASAERRALFATGGGPPERGGVSTDTEWLRKVMPLSMDGLKSVCDDDIIICDEMNNTSNAADAECVQVGEILHDEDRPESTSAPIVAIVPAAAAITDTAESNSQVSTSAPIVAIVPAAAAITDTAESNSEVSTSAPIVAIVPAAAAITDTAESNSEVSTSAPIVAIVPAAAAITDTAESNSEATFDSKAPAFLLRTRLSKPLRPATTAAAQPRDCDSRPRGEAVKNRGYKRHKTI